VSAERDRLVAEARASGTLSFLPKDHFIDGRFVPPAAGRMMESFDPGRGVAFAQFAAGDSADIDAAGDAARKAFTGPWRDLKPAERGRILQRAADLLRRDALRFAVVESLDSGKKLSEAEGDVRSVIRTFEYYAGAADKLQGNSLPLGRDYVGLTVEEPVGVAAQIYPWNYPLSTAARGICPALAAGCTLVAKPAEQTPFSTLLLASLLAEAGLPAGVLNIVTGTGREAGAALVAHPGIDHITFTGSVATGIGVMQAAANNVTRVLLELGGKSPLVVMADADLDTALEGTIGAIYENAGQICSAGSRLLVQREIAESFVERLCRRVEGFTLGHGLSDPDLGPVNSAAQLAKIDRYLMAARATGNHIHTGGTIADEPSLGGGWFYRPTIVSARSPADPLVQEEIFGPVLTVQVFADLEEAITLANGTPYALVAGIYTRDLNAAHRFARDVDAGQVYINEYFAAGIEVPFGGNRKSGFGREKGLEGLRSYCKLKSIVTRLT
jgi:acyl-CoA reductase-like NAD-dependent aldehyde dehydrogenase